MSHVHYYMDESVLTTDSIKIPRLLYTGMLTDVSDWLSEPQSHSFCEILYIISGNGEVTINDEKYYVQSGDIVIYNPGVVHKEHASKDNPFQFLFLALENFSLPGLPPGFLVPEDEKSVFPAGDYRFKLDGLFTELLNETKSHINGYEMMSGSILLSIIILIMRIRFAHGEPDEHNVKLDCQKVKSFIDDNYTKPITLEDLSQIVYISRHHLAHLFKKEIGVPPIKYLIIKRMEEAKRMLVGTELNVSKISEILGYDNPIYFSQIFKKTVGISPANYRERALK